MKICFISNYFNHHQKPFCEALFSMLRTNFVFLATTAMKQERIQLGYGVAELPSYVRDCSRNPEVCDRYLREAEVIILGSASPELVKEQICSGKIVFRYSERLTKSFRDCLKLPVWGLKWRKYYSFRNVYLLCASAFTYWDFHRIGFFHNRAYKWGYYPETRVYASEKLQARKQRRKILWCGRLISWKHPDDAVSVARRLKEEGYVFELEIIGSGVMEQQLKKKIEGEGLSDCVKLLGSMNPERVRNHMEEAGIYLFTSDFNEGWGAVLNESMNSGCAVLASHAIGAVPFLLKNRENGLVYKSGDTEDLYKKIKYLLENPEEQKYLGENAYHTVIDLWNAEIAASRFVHLVEELQKSGSCDQYRDGPCSRSEIIKDVWFKI